MIGFTDQDVPNGPRKVELQSNTWVSSGNGQLLGSKVVKLVSRGDKEICGDYLNWPLVS